MRLFLLLAICLTAAMHTQAQEAVPLSLEECTNYALKHNYSVQNSQIDVLIQQAQNNQVTAAAYPHISGKAEFDDYIGPMYSFFPVGSFSQEIGGFLNPLLLPLYNNAGIQFPTTSTSGTSTNEYQGIQIAPRYGATAAISGSQVLFDGSVLVALQARKTVMELAHLSGEVTKENVRYNVYKAYKSLVIAYRQYDIIKSSLSYARSLEHDMQMTQQNGFAEKIDVERTSVQVNNLATDSIRVGNMLSVSEQLLKFQMGMPINTPIILTDTNLEQNKQDAIALLEEQGDYSDVPEYNLYQTQLLANEYNVKRYKYAALPTLSIFANGGYNYANNSLPPMFDLEKNYLSNFLAGLQLNVPIFGGFLRVNQLQEAKLNVEKAKNNIENIKLSIDFQTAQARTSLRNAILQAQSQRRNMDLANDVLGLAQKRYKAGVGSNVEITQAQTDLLNAQNNYFSALLDIINAEADLRKALGLLK